jgi:cell volume regulation protein A
MTIGQLILARLGGHAEYADRVTIGPIELIVREVDEKGRIISVGVSLEPAAPPPPIPAFLSASEISEWLRGLFVRLKKRGATSAPAADTETPDSYNSRGH